MKLKKEFIVQNVGDGQFLVPTGKEAFHGVLRSNSTAAFIVNLLAKHTTEAQIIDAVWESFDAPRETIAEDVRTILSFLRDIHALEED